MGIEIISSGAACGAEIRGVDLGRDLAAGEIAAIRKAWLDAGIVYFRGQDITDDDLVRFSRNFGELEKSPASEIAARGGSSAPKYPEIWVISNVIENGKPIGSLGAGEAEWHTDMSYVAEPPIASVLYAMEIPPEGGDTSFANQYAALEHLPADLRRAVEGRSVNHNSSYTSAGELRVGAEPVTDVSHAPGTRHAIIRRHPESGRDALFLGRRTNAYVVGLPLAQSEALLDALWDACTSPDLVYRHRWRQGDVLMWDNRCVIHRRESFDPAARRVMHRTQINARKAA